MSKKFYTKGEVMAILNIGQENIDNVLNEYSIEPVSNKKHRKEYSKREIHNLLKNQEGIFNHYDQHYFTYKEVTELGLSTNRLKYYRKEKIPLIARIDKFRLRTTVYFKEDVLFQLNKKESEEKARRILKQEINDPFLIFQQLIDEFGVAFSANAPVTKKYWYSFVRQFLYSAKGNLKTMRKYIHRYKQITEVLVETTQEKELFLHSTNELNLKIFNNNLYQEYRMAVFAFLSSINEQLPYSLITMENLNNPHEEKRKRGKLAKNKSIYSVNEYIDLLDYVSNVNLHKSNSISDIKNAKRNSNSYRKYDSAWLYVLLHMNNAWRSTDVTYFPRIDLTRTEIKGLKWLENNELSQKDAEYIVNQISVKFSFKHAKNRKRRHFFCSEELVYPLANAIAICELRVQEISPEESFLIDFYSSDRSMLPSTHKAFFKYFKANFKFSSLKMNRTFISYMYDVIKKKTGRNPLEISKHIRNHSNFETTNVYIDIPHNHLDYISRQLFDIGYFGYTYDIMAAILLGEPPNNREERTQRSLLVKEIYGDIYKIENLSRYLNIIEMERKGLNKYLSELTAEDLQDKLNLVNLGQLPAKEKYFQCIYGKCVFKERECNKCPLAVPHFHALSSIGERVVKRVNEFSKLFNQTSKKGEKARISNLLYADLLLLKEAKEKFGQDVVSEFMQCSYDELKELIRTLPDPNEFITLK